MKPTPRDRGAVARRGVRVPVHMRRALGGDGTARPPTPTRVHAGASKGPTPAPSEPLVWVAPALAPAPQIADPAPSDAVRRQRKNALFQEENTGDWDLGALQKARTTEPHPVAAASQRKVTLPPPTSPSSPVRFSNAPTLPFLPPVQLPASRTVPQTRRWTGDWRPVAAAALLAVSCIVLGGVLYARRASSKEPAQHTIQALHPPTAPPVTEVLPPPPQVAEHAPTMGPTGTLDGVEDASPQAWDASTSDTDAGLRTTGPQGVAGVRGRRPSRHGAGPNTPPQPPDPTIF